jgi:hypothetical protein
MTREPHVGLEVGRYAGRRRHREVDVAGNKTSIANLVSRLSISRRHYGALDHDLLSSRRADGQLLGVVF